MTEQLSLMQDSVGDSDVSPQGHLVTQETRTISDREIPYLIGEFWTSKQRQANPIHEVSYRACFKPQLPEYFIERYTNKFDLVYDPFGGRGTTAIQAALMERNIIQNDINPLSEILTMPRLEVPEISEIQSRLESFKVSKELESDIDLSMFYHKETLIEILSWRDYFKERIEQGNYDHVDRWINMVATNRLTGHSKGFFSVYTFPPNLAVSADSQKRINEKRNQKPEYRDFKSIVFKKSKSLQGGLSPEQRMNLRRAAGQAKFLCKKAHETSNLAAESVNLVVTSPPFLDIVQYSDDNWLRCWFNQLDTREISSNITMSKDIASWAKVMNDALRELYRLLKPGGHIAFEVGEVRNKTLNLDEVLVPLAIRIGFNIEMVILNVQDFTKTSNLWGISNNKQGTNTNRILLMSKSN